MLRITELRLPLNHPEPALRDAVRARLGVPDAALCHVHVFRRAWDARRKSAIQLIYTVDCTLADGVEASSRSLRPARLLPSTGSARATCCGR